MRKRRKKGANKDDFQSRYGENWADISRAVKRATNGLCCYPCCENRATETHHSLYSINGQKIAGTKFERNGAGSILFPLCDYHHSSKHRDGAHHPRNWKWDRKNPVDGNRNTLEYYRKLRSGYLSKTKKTALNLT